MLEPKTIILSPSKNTLTIHSNDTDVEVPCADSGMLILSTGHAVQYHFNNAESKMIFNLASGVAAGIEIIKGIEETIHLTESAAFVADVLSYYKF